MNTSVTEALVLNFFNVHKQFGEREVLRGLSLGLGRGTCVALLGRNGAGKSTTVALALGLTQPDEGRVDLFTTDMSDPEAHTARARVGVVSQYDSLDPDFTVVENLFVYGRYFGLSRQVMEQRVAELLAFADLADRRHDPVASLSGGMRRRLMLARALVAKPEVLFLDEPTTGLDPQARHAIWSGLAALKREGVAMLLTSHDMVEAQRLADEVVVLEQGKAIAMGSPAQLIAEHAGLLVLEVWGLEAKTYLAQRLKLNVDGLDTRGDRVFVYDDMANKVFERIRAERPKAVECTFRHGHLEDVYFRLTGRELQDA